MVAFINKQLNNKKAIIILFIILLSPLAAHRTPSLISVVISI